MNDPFAWLTHWLADVLLLGSLLLLLGHVALSLLRQPAQRVTLAWGVVLGLFMLLVIAAFPLWPRQSLWRVQRQEEAQSARGASPATVVVVPVAELPADMVASAASVQPQNITAEPHTANSALEATAGGPSPLVANLLRLWLGGVLIALGWITLGAWQAARLLRRSQAPPAWTQQELAQIAVKRRQPRLLISPRLATAVALCARRPHIVLPAGSVEPENVVGVRAALAHEWAHIRNGDLWLLALERLLLPVFFWHPLFWLFRRRIRLDQELLADAAAAGEQRVEYAEALLAWAKLAVAAQPPLGMAALSLWESPRSLSRRVEMILQGNNARFSNPSRRWRFVVLAGMLVAVLGLSLVTLRPTASAQDDAERAEAKQRQRARPKKKKDKPARDSMVVPAPKRTEQDQDAAIQMSMQVLEVDQRKLADAGVSFDELVTSATGERCQLIDGVIVAANEPKPLAALVGRLKEQDFATVISTPQVITLDQQEATVQIGSEVPLLEVEETANGQTSSRIEYKNAGLLLTIKPSLNAEATGSLTLDVAIERSRLLPPRKGADAESAARVFKTQRLHVTTDVELNQAVLLAEPQPNRTKKDDQSTLLIVISPVRLSAPPRATAVHPPLPHADKVQSALVKLNAENDELRKQVARLQKQLDDARVRATTPAVETADRIVKVFALKDTPARRVMEVIEQLRKDGRNVVLKQIALDERTNSIIVSGNQEELVIVGNVIAAIDKTGAPPAERASSPPEKLADRLRALDLREAEVKLRAAQTNLERLRAVASSNSLSVPEQDLLAAQFEVEKATLMLESIKSNSNPLAKQKIEVRLAEVRLRNAQLHLERVSAVVKEGSATQLELDAAQFEVEKAKIDLDRAKAKLDATSSEADLSH